jgi:hypothetical protein
MAIVAPFAGQDEPLKIVLASAREFLAAPATARPGDVATPMTARIEETLGKGKRMSVSQLASHRTRALLERRRYRTRNVFGAEHLHATVDLVAGDDRKANKAPVYILREAGMCFPLAQRFRVKMLAEIRPAVDPRDEALWALRVLAIARLLEQGGTT